MKMSDHANILKAYIDRLSLKDIKDILFHHESCYQEMLNGNANSQKNADIVLYATILNIFERMLSPDKKGIDSIIEKTFNSKG